MIRNSNVGLDHLRGLFAKQSIATMDQLKKTVGTVADLTVYRKLRELDYCASYSHRGRFYTLRELAEFDENGLWWIRSIGFSTRGTLVATAEGLVDASEAGYAVEELDAIVRVGTKDVLPKLVREKRLRHTRIGNRNVYFSHKRSVRSQQIASRCLPFLVSHAGSWHSELASSHRRRHATGFGSVAIPTAVFRTLVATTPQRLVDFFLEHDLDRLQYPLTQPKLDELPVLAYRLLRYGGRLLHGVIFLLAFTGVVWFFLTGGYAILISTGIGTDPSVHPGVCIYPGGGSCGSCGKPGGFSKRLVGIAKRFQRPCGRLGARTETKLESFPKSSIGPSAAAASIGHRRG